MRTIAIHFAHGPSLQVLVPETVPERAQGLGYLKAIDTPMLFLGTCSVWTGPMRVPIDLVFLRKLPTGDRLVTRLVRSVPPDGATYRSDCTDVLEMATGEIDRLGLSEDATSPSRLLAIP